MAIAFDARTNPTETTATTLSFTHTAGAGSNKYLLVVVRCTGGVSTTGVTCGGSAMTKIGSEISVAGGGGPFMVSVWRFFAPATGSNAIVVTAASSSTIRAGAITYTGVRQSSQPDSNSTGSGSASPMTANTTVVVSDCWLFMAGRDGASTDTSSGGSVVRSTSPDAGGVVFGDSNGTVTTGSQSLSFVQDSSNAWGSIIISIAPASHSLIAADVVSFSETAAFNRKVSLSAADIFSTSDTTRFSILPKNTSKSNSTWTNPKKS